MRKVLLCTTALLLVAGMAFAESAEKKLLAETVPPDGQGIRALDCSGATPISCGDVVTGNNTGIPSTASAYSCVSWNESGGEVVYTLTLTEASIVTAALSGMTGDLDMFLLTSCDENSCINYGDNSMTSSCLDPGTYYLVVDGYNGAQSAFTLTVNCVSCAPPENDVCETAIDLCAVAGEKRFDGSFNLAFNTALATNDYDPGSGGCTGYSAQGPDLVYVVCLEPGGTLDACMNPSPYFDGSIYLITDCADPVNSCVAGDDSGNPECIVYTSVAGGTYYLIVDGWSSSSAGTGTLYGSVTGCCTTSTEEGSWGGVKTLFR
ncbi:MAG: PPC domain-containing protein [Candidatus Eisenbacteria bacterium]